MFNSQFTTIAIMKSFPACIKSKHIATLLSVLALVTFVTISPHAFAQQGSSSTGQQNGIPLGPPYGTPGYVDPNAVYGWSAGIAIVAIMSGVGVWSAVKKR